jgi:hypothetical protein
MYLATTEVYSTRVSLSPVMPAPEERRLAKRHIGTLRVGKLITMHRQELCLIRNISVDGLMAHVHGTHAPGERVWIELKGGNRLVGRIVWAANTNVGVQFDRAIDVRQVLDFAEHDDQHQPRAPRLDVRAWTTLRIGADLVNTRIHDISQGGMKCQLAGNPPIGAPAVATIEKLGIIEGAIRWRTEDFVGVSFNSVLSFNELARWVAVHGV